jgi:pilus assembly protein FimV
MGELVPAAEPIETVVESAAPAIPAFEFPKFDPVEAEKNANQLGGIAATVAATAVANETFDLPAFDMPSELVTNDNDAVFAAAENAEDNDFNFDIEVMSPDTASLSEPTSLPEVSTYDLSDVSFDMDDTEGANLETASAEEPIQVETKLDLVAAYIEMDDKEGAKELLAEVMKEGGATQRHRAEAILATLA